MRQDDVSGLNLERLRHHLDQQRSGPVSGDLHAEAIHSRHTQGHTAGAGFDRFGDAVGPLLTRALDTRKD
jgi:hypothetical protein